MAGAVDGVEDREDERADLVGAGGSDDGADLVGEVVGGEDPGADGVLEVVADVGDAVGPGDDFAFGGRGGWATPGVVADPVEGFVAQVEGGQRDVGAVDGVVVAGGGQIGGECFFGRGSGRSVTTVVGQRDGLGEGQAQVDGAGDAGGDLGDFDGVGQAGAEMVVFGGDEHLAFPGEAPPGAGVLDPVEVPFEAEPVGVGGFGAGSVAGADGSGGAGGEPGGEVRLAFLSGAGGAADVGVVRSGAVSRWRGWMVGASSIRSRVPVRCDAPMGPRPMGWRT